MVQWGSALCSPVPMFPGTYVPRTYVPRYLCSPVPMFPGTDVPRTYVHRYLCSPVPMFPEPMFPGTYVPRFTANVLYVGPMYVGLVIGIGIVGPQKCLRHQTQNVNGDLAKRNTVLHFAAVLRCAVPRDRKT